MRLTDDGGMKNLPRILTHGIQTKPHSDKTPLYDKNRTRQYPTCNIAGFVAAGCSSSSSSKAKSSMSRVSRTAGLWSCDVLSRIFTLPLPDRKSNHCNSMTDMTRKFIPSYSDRDCHCHSTSSVYIHDNMAHSRNFFHAVLMHVG